MSAAPLGGKVLEWLLRRVGHGGDLTQSLVIVVDHPALGELPAGLFGAGRLWRVARVSGELTLRDALVEDDSLVAVVPDRYFALPLDLAAQAALGQPLPLRAEDVVSACTDRPCEALRDETLIQAVFASVETLRDAAPRWSLGDRVSEQELRAELAAALLGVSRLGAERDWELLSRLVTFGAPTLSAPGLVRAALIEAHRRTGALLAWALDEGDVASLCVAGALAATPEALAKAPRAPRLDAQGKDNLAGLVELALRDAATRSPAQVEATLAEAERIARGMSLDPAQHPLLRLPLEAKIVALANKAAAGQPAEDAEIESLKRNLHARSLAPSLSAVGAMSRLARLLRTTPQPEDAAGWGDCAQSEVAWGDLALRQLRRARPDVLPSAAGAVDGVIGQVVEWRDALNHRFGVWLAARWADVATSRDLSAPVALHQLSRLVMRPILDEGHRLLLIVLDGCDLTSALELVQSLPEDRRLGVVNPDWSTTRLADRLRPLHQVRVAVSPIPTVTAHSRRALFAGELPGDLVLAEAESAAANASADPLALRRNGALQGVSARLLLKGDLGDGQPLLGAINDTSTQLVAVVLNAIDDSLSNKETSPPPAWTFSALGVPILDAISSAIQHNMVVMVTADHGHTTTLRMVSAPRAEILGPRARSTPGEGAVTFDDGPLPTRPLHLMTSFGAVLGPARRGAHGGASVEEVMVPLLFLGEVSGAQAGQLTRPSWWWSLEGIAAEARPTRRAPPPRPEPRPEPTPPPRPEPTPAPSSDPRLDALSAEERGVYERLRALQSVRLSQLSASLGRPLVRVSGMLNTLNRKLLELGLPGTSQRPLPDGDRMVHLRDDDHSG